MEGLSLPLDVDTPPGTVDCHVHVVEDHVRYPQLPGRHYLAAPAAVAALRQAARGVRRFVVVQPSFYGTDNGCTLAAVDALGPDGRAVVVVEPGIDFAQLQRMKVRGAVGLRVNLATRLRDDSRHIHAVLGPQVAIARRMGWHLNLNLPLATLVGVARQLEVLDVPIVLDHFACPDGRLPSAGEADAVLALASHQHVWVKLSAPYRTNGDPLATVPPPAWLRSLLEVAADRCLWGSDWPHMPPIAQQSGPDCTPPYRAIGYPALLRNFATALGSPLLASRIMAANAQRLYGFPPR